MLTVDYGNVEVEVPFEDATWLQPSGWLELVVGHATGP
jgi:hypothetical protein